MRILLVDDAPSILKVTRRFLKSHGHTVYTAENGSEALEKLKSGRVNSGTDNATVDLMITDIQMPIMDGVECTTRFRAWESKMALNASSSYDLQEKEDGSDRLVIMGMSANNDEEFARTTLSMGFDLFISKVKKSSNPSIHPSHHIKTIVCITHIVFMSSHRNPLSSLLPHSPSTTTCSRPSFLEECHQWYDL